MGIDVNTRKQLIYQEKPGTEKVHWFPRHSVSAVCHRQGASQVQELGNEMEQLSSLLSPGIYTVLCEATSKQVNCKTYYEAEKQMVNIR